MRRLLVALVVVLALSYAADRASVVLVQRRLAAQIQEQERLDHRPTVTLRGFPFLTQVVRGRYAGGHVVLGRLGNDRLRVQMLTVDVSDVHLPIRMVLTGQLDAVPVGEVRGTAVISYADLAAATGIRGLQVRASGNRLELTLPISEFGQTLRLIVSAQVAIRGGRLLITAGKVQGAPIPQALVDLALGGLSNAVPVPHLPFGLQITAARTGAGGVELLATARNVTLRRPAG